MVTGIAASVLLGNVLAAAFVWGMIQAAKYERGRDAPWLVLAAIFLPSAFIVLAIIAAGEPVPWLS